MFIAPSQLQKNGTGARTLVKGETFWSHMELFASVASSTLSPEISVYGQPKSQTSRVPLPECSREIRCLTVNSSSIRFGQISERERDLTTRKRESGIPKCLRDIPDVLHDAGTKYGDTDVPWLAGFDQVSCKLVAPLHSEVATVWAVICKTPPWCEGFISD